MHYPMYHIQSASRIGNILRFFGKRGFLQSREWVPHTPMLQSDSAGVFASAWPLGAETVWTIVNRGKANSTGMQIAVHSTDTRRYYDCYHGVPLTVAPALNKRGSYSDGAGVSFSVDAADYGCVLATPNTTLSEATVAFLNKMQAMTRRSLASYPNVWKPLLQRIVYVNQTTPPPPTVPEDMVQIPAASNFRFQVSGVEIEGSTVPGVSFSVLFLNVVVWMCTCL